MNKTPLQKIEEWIQVAFKIHPLQASAARKAAVKAKNIFQEQEDERMIAFVDWVRKNYYMDLLGGIYDFPGCTGESYTSTELLQIYRKEQEAG